MRICYIANGATIHTQRWVNYFAKRGHEVHLISSMPTSGKGYAKGVQLHLLVRLMPRIWPVTRYFSGLLWLAQVRRLVRKIKPDILHAHYITVYGCLGAVSGFHPFVVSAWGSDVLFEPRENFFLKAITEYALANADLITCDGENIQEPLIALAAKSQNITTVYHGVEIQRFRPGQKSERLKEKLGILDSAVVISLRNLKPIYNVESLLNAIPLVLEAVPEAKFIIAGEGDQRQYLENLAASLGVSTSVRFLGMIAHDQLPQYLTSSDVYVSTSLSDSFAVSTLEAMACGLAPVITDIGDNRRWIKDGENGFIVPIKDPEALAERIVYLLENEELRKKFGEINRRIIEEKADYYKEMEKMDNIYKELIKEHKS